MPEVLLMYVLHFVRGIDYEKLLQQNQVYRNLPLQHQLNEEDNHHLYGANHLLR